VSPHVLQDSLSFWHMLPPASRPIKPSLDTENRALREEIYALREQNDTLRAAAAAHAQQQQAAIAELATLNEELTVANEELYAANGDLVRVNGELNTFLYAASHDLRAPIANLEGQLQALADHLPAGALGAAPADAVWGLVHASVARFRHALDRLTDFGAARHMAASPREKVALAAAAAGVRAEVAPLLAATGGRLEVELAGHPVVWFSPPHLHSVLLNLVSNALKYRHPDRAPVVRVRAYRDATRVVVRVEDNGRGLSDAQQGQLFRLFRRFHPDVPGTGVGLYVVKKILEQAGGTIAVESQPGHGATFTLVIPA
jgi:signal transduction histidine kinase